MGYSKFMGGKGGSKGSGKGASGSFDYSKYTGGKGGSKKGASGSFDYSKFMGGKGASTGAPSGTYTGEKKILGEDIKASVTIDDSSHMDLVISGAISISCKNEAYSLSGSTVNVPGASKAGDCIHDALQKETLSLEGITYDSGANTVTIKVKKSFIGVTFVLTHTGKDDASGSFDYSKFMGGKGGDKKGASGSFDFSKYMGGKGGSTSKGGSKSTNPWDAWMA